MAFMKKRKSKKLKIQGVYEVGDLVLLNKKRQGIIKYIGQLHNKDGIWYGIELTGDKHKGDNNGNIGKQQYFECDVKGKGIFAKPKHLVQILAKSQKKKEAVIESSKSNEETKENTEKNSQTIENIVGSPQVPSNIMNDDINEFDDNFLMDDPKLFQPFKAPSQQTINVESNLDQMLQTVPKSNGYKHHKPVYQQQPTQQQQEPQQQQKKQKQSIIDESDYIQTPGGPDDDFVDEDDDDIIDEDNHNNNDNNNNIDDNNINNDNNMIDETEIKRARIQKELNNNLRPIELMDKLAEFIDTVDDIQTIEMLQRIINYEPDSL